MYSVDVALLRVPHDTCMLLIVCIYTCVYTGADMVGQGSECVQCRCCKDVVLLRVPLDICTLRIVCIYRCVYTGADVVGHGSECAHNGCGGAESAT